MNRYKKDLLSSKRFTLIEILVVVGILAILMGIGLGVMNLAMTKAKENRTKALIKKIEIALESYKAKTGYYLQSLSLAEFKLPKDTDEEFRKSIDNYQKFKENESEDGYIIDGFGERLKYQCPGTHNTTSFDIWSGGDDPAVADNDITNY